MKLIKQIKLSFKEGNSDKVYEVDLCELSRVDDERYFVNFRYGRRGSKLREGTKTAEPCSLRQANKLFDSVIIAKTSKGYIDESNKENIHPAKVKPEQPALTPSVSSSIIAKLESEKNSKQRARYIWRLGEIADKSSIEVLSSGVLKGHWLEDYSIAWALGRIGDNKTLPIIDKLINGNNKIVHSLAVEVQLLLMPQEQRDSYLAEVSQKLPQQLRKIISEHSSNEQSVTPLTTLLSQWFGQKIATHNTSLTQLYQLSLGNQTLKSALVNVMAVIAFEPGYFKGIRHIFKMAELRLDAQMFGALTQQFETNKAFFDASWGWHYDRKTYENYKVKDEQLKDDSKLAYSAQTRHYLRRRSWRSLKRLAQLGDEHYLHMAIGILLAVTDDAAGEKKTSNYYGWDSDSRKYDIVRTNHYGHFASLLAFNHIIHGNSTSFKLNSGRTAWLQISDKDNEMRHESYGQLWDEKPELLIDLLVQSHCQAVHIFALNIIKDHSHLNATLTPQTLITLLKSPYLLTQNFALTVIEQQLNELGFVKALVLALVHCDIEKAQQLAIEQLNSNKLQWLNDFEIITCLVISPSLLIQQWFHSNISTLRLGLDEQQVLAKQLISHCLHTDELAIGQCQQILRFFKEQLSQYSLTIDLLLLETFVSHQQRWVQQLGAGLLLLNAASYKDIPAKLKADITSSQYDEVRALAIALLAKQNISDLVAQTHTIADLYYHADEQVRAAICTLVEQSCESSTEFSQGLFNALIDLSFKAETKDGQHLALEQLCLNIINNAENIADKGLIWRLLQAQSKAAKQIGCELLVRHSPSLFSVNQWAVLAKHNHKRVRLWCQSAYLANPDDIKNNVKEAMIILDSPWLDSREFAINYFREHFNDDQWQADLIIYVCDNYRDDVQAFGREMLQRFFQEQQGEHYLLQLSQHPTENVQLFASNFLADYAANKPDVIVRLRHYFITVLSLVNRGRICKDRVYKFLLQQALLDHRVAQLVADIFSRQSITSIIKDKSFLLRSMLKLQTLYPDLSFPLEYVKKPIWQKTQG
jgi:hypothetical protein